MVDHSFIRQAEMCIRDRYVTLIRTPVSYLLRTRSIVVNSMGGQMTIPWIPLKRAEDVYKRQGGDEKSGDGPGGRLILPGSWLDFREDQVKADVYKRQALGMVESLLCGASAGRMTGVPCLLYTSRCV